MKLTKKMADNNTYTKKEELHIIFLASVLFYFIFFFNNIYHCQAYNFQSLNGQRYADCIGKYDFPFERSEQSENKVEL